MDQKTQQWVHLGYLPYEALHKKWQWYLLEMVKRQLDTQHIEALVDDCYKRYPNGFVAYGRHYCITFLSLNPFASGSFEKNSLKNLSWGLMILSSVSISKSHSKERKMAIGGEMRNG